MSEYEFDYDSEPQSPNSRIVGSERAAWLIYSHYTDLLGESIRYETTRSLRMKLDEIENRMREIRTNGPSLEFQVLVRQCLLYQRVGELLEMAPSFR